MKRNIEILEHSKGLLVSKQSFLEGNMKNKQAAGNKGASAHAKQVQAEQMIQAVSSSLANMYNAAAQGLDEKSALIMLQQFTGCHLDVIQTLSDKITHVLEDILGISHEDKSNKIEMLRKIEGELTYMCEKREYLAAKPKGTLMGNGQLLDLHALESKVDRDRKETKRNLKLEKDRAI